jgi:uncharacterized protein (DUF1800 family)
MKTRTTLTRRQALGVAAGSAGGVAATAVALRFGVPELLAATNRIPAVSAGGWASPLSGSRGLAAHLLRRAGFGHTTAQLDAAAAMSYDDLVESVLNQQPEALPVPADVTSHALINGTWYAHMATTQAQFPERMALFWHGVLTSDYHNANRLPFVYQQNVLMRTSGRSDLRTLLLAITHDPLMMRYLNLDVSTAVAPNENFSRELMELFTLGPGNYSEDDVREGARALSGVRVELLDASGNRMPAPRYDKADPSAFTQQVNALSRAGATFRGVVVARVHDQGSKTFLGRTGNLGPSDVVDAILAQPACAPFVTRRAMTFFATPTPSAGDVNAVAAQFRASRYDIRTLMRAIFHSEAFTNPANYRSLVRSPTDYMVAIMRATGPPQRARQAVIAATGMDQVLYNPPSVAGWPSNSGWLSSGTLLARVNFAEAASSAPGLPDPSAVVRNELDGVLGPDTLAAYNAARTSAARWYALLAGPEFQLK